MVRSAYKLLLNPVLQAGGLSQLFTSTSPGQSDDDDDDDDVDDDDDHDQSGASLSTVSLAEFGQLD